MATFDRKDGTGITYGGQGKAMDLDEAHWKWLCFKCGKAGHMAWDCLDRSGFSKSSAVKAGLPKDSHDSTLSFSSSSVVIPKNVEKNKKKFSIVIHVAIQALVVA